MREITIPPHDVVIENDSALAATWFAGFAARFTGRAGRSTWVHIAVPTPVIVNDRRLQLAHVSVRYRTGAPDAWLSAVHVYDGENRVAAHEALFAASEAWAVKRLAVVAPPVRWGLGLSLLISFARSRSPQATNASASFQFHLGAVGVSFQPAIDLQRFVPLPLGGLPFIPRPGS